MEMRFSRLKSVRRRSKLILSVSLICSLVLCAHVFGVFVHPFELELSHNFSYPLVVHNLREVIEALKSGQTLASMPTPINEYGYRYVIRNQHKCHNSSVRLLIVVKSALQHSHRRHAIRKSWGFERRFSDVGIKVVFVLGSCVDRTDFQSCQDLTDEEFATNGDLVQMDFVDSYYNNTIKTMTAFKWVAHYCSNAHYILFIDDDYYLSVKNLLKFLRNKYYPNSISLNKFESLYDDRLYSGYVFPSSPPMRHKISKWFVSLKEYPYATYPPYVTAGAFVMSNQSLLDMYYASYYTKHFRFDDIYVAILAKKVGITPLHNENFHFWDFDYSPDRYKNVIASHGYSDTNKLLLVWNQQKSLGNA